MLLGTQSLDGLLPCLTFCREGLAIEQVNGKHAGQPVHVFARAHQNQCRLEVQCVFHTGEVHLAKVDHEVPACLRLEGAACMQVSRGVKGLVHDLCPVLFVVDDNEGSRPAAVAQGVVHHSDSMTPGRAALDAFVKGALPR